MFFQGEPALQGKLKKDFQRLVKQAMEKELEKERPQLLADLSHDKDQLFESEKANMRKFPTTMSFFISCVCIILKYVEKVF